MRSIRKLHCLFEQDTFRSTSLAIFTFRSRMSLSCQPSRDVSRHVTKARVTQSQARTPFIPTLKDTASSSLSVTRRNMSMIGSPSVQRLSGRGQIQLIVGPMFSGKTTELIRRMKRYQVANRSCLMIKYSKDDRYSTDNVSTHDRQVTKAVASLKLNDLKTKALDYGVVGIDEAQFFPDVVQFCEDLANAGKTVIVAALDGTFQRKPFGSILDLIPLSESVIKLKAVCMNCFQDAAFSKRIGSEMEVEVIGGTDKYMAVCRECYHLPATHSSSAVTPCKLPVDSGTQGRELFPNSPTKLS